MTKEQLSTLRERLGWTQAELAAALGMTWRAYNDLENGRSEIRKVYSLALERIALHEAAERGEATIAPASVRHDALNVSRANDRTFTGE